MSPWARPSIPFGIGFISLKRQVMTYPSLLALRASWSRRAAGVDIPSEHRPLARERPTEESDTVADCYRLRGP